MGIFVVDLWLPLGVAAPVLYVIPVLLASWAKRRLALPTVAISVSALTLVGIMTEPAAVIPSWVVVWNRAMALLIIWITAVLCVRRQRSEEAVRRICKGIEREVAQRTADLEQAIRELDALRTEALARLGTVMQSSDDAIVGLTPEGMIVSWNEGAERIYGYGAEEITGQSVGALLPTDRRREFRQILRRVRREGRLRNFETVLVKKHGKKIDVSLTISTVKDEAGKAIGILSIARDVTKRKRMEAELRESEARFRMLADTAPVMVWMSAPESGCTFFNKRWLEFCGRTMQVELGDGWLSGVHPNDQARCKETYRVAMQNRQPFTMEYRLRRKDGVYRWVVDTGVPRVDEDGVLVGYIGSCIDLTERKEMEDELRKTVKEKESLLREVHHRVKNNLQVISSLLNLQAASIKDPQIVQLFRECQVRISSIALLHETLHRSSDLSRIKMGEYFHTLTRHLFRSYGVDPQAIRLDVQVDDIELDIDTGVTCGLIVDELVSNCLKHAFGRGVKGHIGIELHRNQDGSYMLKIADDGAGIPRDGVLSNPDSLGLDLVTLLVEKLEGSTKVESGKGTDWTITFYPLHYKERM
jgi:PAS domain S-box-containing protein